MKAFLTFLFFVQSGLALANDAVVPDSCGWLQTEAECQRHRQTLAELRDESARQAYLEQHLAMLREREVMCACTRERQSLARAQYR